MKCFTLFSFLAIFSCQAPERVQENKSPALDKNEVVTVAKLPEDLQKVLEEHGGIKKWRQMQSLSFEIAKESGNEKHFVHLVDRRDRVEGPDFTMGFDGNDIWMEADTTYDGNPEFYHNLMFYFYAMPFVLADDGIKYGNREPLEFEGISYPGISISYNDGVGTSSKDEYFLYYDPDSYQMAWLGYTVTYFSKETSKDVHWLRYSEWGDFNGLRLPTAITWYKYKDHLPTVPRNRVPFVNVKVSDSPLPDEIFLKP